jgi:glycosyltransferase involved in cell wall biosynthesis
LLTLGNPTLTALNPIHLSEPPERDRVEPSRSTNGSARDNGHSLPTVRPVILAPTHNNAGTLPDVLRRLAALGIAIIAIDDGSTDATAGLLAGWVSECVDHRVVTHSKNLGKAAALRSGFTAALEAGFTHAITIDTDGQHAPEDIPALLQKSIEHESALVLGTRDSSSPGYPGRSRFGRSISNSLILFETGQQLMDSQCGLRIYPLKWVGTIACHATHFGFETEIITRAIWAGVPIVELPVQCRYFAAADRVSHFKPVIDSLRALQMHAGLIVTALNPFHGHDLPAGSAPPHSLIRQFFRWLNPITAWRQVRHTEGARERFSAAFALGVFIANLPLYGVQTILCLYLARRFRLPPTAMVAGVHINVPPMGPIMIAFAIAVGHLILHGAWPHWSTYHGAGVKLNQILLPMLIEWVVGSFFVGIVMAGAAFVILDFALRLLVEAPGDASR